MHDNQKLAVIIDRDYAEGVLAVLRRIIEREEALSASADEAGHIYFPGHAFYAEMFTRAIEEALTEHHGKTARA